MANYHTEGSVGQNFPQDLPNELRFEVMKHLKARDIVSLCSTCHIFRSILSQRAVWILILCSVCREDGVFLPSYDIDQMDVQELRSAAMGRYRWGQLLEQNCVRPKKGELLDGVLEGSEDPDTVHDLHPLILASGPIGIPLAAQEDSRLGGGFCFRLIPGGRFLVIAANHTVSLLDLGAPGKPLSTTPVEIAKVAIRKFEGTYYHSRLSAWEHDSNCIRVAVGIESSNDEVFSVTVYAIEPSSVNPEFQILGSVLAVHSEDRALLWRLQVHGNLLYIGSDYVGALVWDFEVGRYTVVPAFESNALNDEPAAFTGAFLARFASQELHLFPIPSPDLEVPPHRRILLPGNDAQKQSKMVFPYPFLQHIIYPWPLVLLPSSLPHVSFPITLDTHPPDFANKTKTTWRYSVNLIQQNPGDPDSVDVTFDLKMTYSLPPRLSRFGLLDNYRALTMGYPSATVVEVDDEVEGTMYHSVLSVVPPGQSSSHHTTGDNAALTILRRVDDFEARTLCANTGRSIYSEGRRFAGGKPTIHVVDYLSPSVDTPCVKKDN